MGRMGSEIKTCGDTTRLDGGDQASREGHNAEKEKEDKYSALRSAASLWLYSSQRRATMKGAQRSED